MKETKLQSLLRAARQEATPSPSGDFAEEVLRELRRPPAIATRVIPADLFDQLAALLPRLAVATALVLGLCVAADLALSAWGSGDLASGMQETSEQWLFAVR